MDIARRGIEVGREAIEQAGRTDEVALAFSINGDIDGPAGASSSSCCRGLRGPSARPHPAGDHHADPRQA
jgi:hypothetical protein